MGNIYEDSMVMLTFLFLAACLMLSWYCYLMVVLHRTSHRESVTQRVSRLSLDFLLI